MKPITLLICWILIFLSCNRQVESMNVIKVQNKNNAVVHDFIVSSELIFLETTSDNYIGSINKICVDDSLLYILDRQRERVFIFDITGKYLSEINRKGRGNDEYVELRDINIKDGEIFILSRSNKAIYVYNDATEFQRMIPLNDWYNNFEILDDNTILLYSEKSNKQMYDIVAIDNKGQIINRFIPFHKTNGYNFGISPFHRIAKNEYLLTFPYDNRVFHLTDEGCEVEYIFDFNTEYKIEEELDNYFYKDIVEKFRYKNILERITSIYQTSNKLYGVTEMFYDGWGRRQLLFSVDLATGKQNVLRFGDLIDEEYPYFNNVLQIVDGNVYSWQSAMTFIHLNVSDENKKYSNLKESDNPVIFISKLK